MCSLKILRRDHGLHQPLCVGERTMAWMLANDWMPCGTAAAVLERAGVTKAMPFYTYTWEETRDAHGKRIGHTKEYLVEYYPVAPTWAVTLARRLMREDEIIRKVFGNKVKLEKRVGLMAARKASRHGQGRVVSTKERDDVVERAVIPISLRAKIIRSATNAMTRELLEDDLLAALTIIKDSV